MSVKVIGKALRELLQPFENNVAEGLLHLSWSPMNWRCGIFICRECERTVYVFPVFLDVREWERTVTAKLPPSLCRAVYGRSEVKTTAIPRSSNGWSVASPR